MTHTLPPADEQQEREYREAIADRDEVRFWRLLQDIHRGVGFDAVNATLDAESAKWMSETLGKGPPWSMV